MLTDNFGTARWAEKEDLDAEGIQVLPLSPLQEQNSYASRIAHQSQAKVGLILGKLANPEESLAGIRLHHTSSMEYMFKSLKSLFTGSRGTSEYFTWAGDGHALTVAPTRSGKGVGLVIPNLLRYTGSVIVIDPKGENYAITSEARRRFHGQQIIRLDPFGCQGRAETTDYINPLDGIDPNSPEAIDELSAIADSMIIRPADEKDPHWNDKARTLIKTLLMAVVCEASNCDIVSMRELLTGGSIRGILRNLAGWKEMGGALAASANECLQMADGEFSSVLSSALKQTEFLESPLMQRAFGRNNRAGARCNIRNLKTEGNVSIYLIIPPQHLERYARAIRVWVTAAMNAMTATSGKPKGGNVLFMMDEIAQLGTLEKLRQAVSLLAGYGMSIWMIWQDLSQLKRLYKEDWQTFLANAKIQQFFGINDLETAKYVSEMLGKATVPVLSHTTTHGSSGKVLDILNTNSDGVSDAESEKERDLLMPDEIRRLNRMNMLMFVQGIPPILAERISYFSDSNFKDYASENPYRKSVDPKAYFRR